MTSKSKETCSNVSSLHPNSVGAIAFKITDLKRDVDSVKATYECGSDPNKPRIERVLSNMKRKIIKAEQIMKFGQNITARTITRDRTRSLYGRVDNMKKLLKELMKDLSAMTKADRKALCQMYHQLLSMEDDLVHFTEPVHDHSGSSTCKSIGEPHFTTIKDCEVQTNKSDGCGQVFKTPSPCKSTVNNKQLVYTGIGFSRPQYGTPEGSSSSVEATWNTMYTFSDDQANYDDIQISLTATSSSLESVEGSIVSVSLNISSEDINHSSNNNQSTNLENLVESDTAAHSTEIEEEELRPEEFGEEEEYYDVT